MNNEKIIGIFLAAGKSRRMGIDKLNLPFGEGTIGSTTLQSALESTLDQLIVIVRPSDQFTWIPKYLLKMYAHKLKFIRCNNSWKGQSYSIRCGMKRAEQMNAKAAVIILGDQPLVSYLMIDRLISTYKEYTMDDIWYVASSCQQGRLQQPPILFDRMFFPKLKTLEGDHGARYLLKDKEIKGINVPFVNSQYFWDIDTIVDYIKVTSFLSRDTSNEVK